MCAEDETAHEPSGASADAEQAGAEGGRPADAAVAEPLRDEARVACRRIRDAWRDLWR